ncbi:B-cell receptor CD22 isoform X4 [Canis lupus baileyi]|uniref:B-cell receptor CD22 isoform X5 n=1 Tax=Canis lupus familiaris TaxID=9615 RepID=UPI000BAA3116|nr:B-cell receptor CD22 isoform X5 [Canis lupus familiaris]XP_025277294.1 B-cell receptor CD22 isoform X5 [Canis lupus dingo]XP_038385270.1 B-cell receptor CD22 isoform X5 [Canis lupus familiaris]XP_038513382.1 B-cell receptor CD22 isoform X5 [Canis lupus familiaris]|eukprot:XP_005616771.3 B-cell receptor CD22 isoform X3 [Canis lupus familiaris]
MHEMTAGWARVEMLPGSPKKEDTRKQPRLLPRHSTMHLLGPLLLLLEYLAFSDSSYWRFDHPHTLYTWEKACVWIPCCYTIPESGSRLEKLTVYSNYEYNDTTKDFQGSILYETKEFSNNPPQEMRVQFLGNERVNCTLRINPVSKEDNGWLGIRVNTKTDKWMEKINLNVSKTPLPPHIQLPPEIQESQEVTLTCLLNFSCPGFPIQLKWSLQEPAVTLTSLSTKTVSTQSKLTFRPQWTHHGKNLTCQLWDHKAERVLSEDTVCLDVKHPPKEVTAVIQNPTRIREGDNVTVSCNYNSSNPRVSRYEWNVQGSRNKVFSEVLVIQKVSWDARPIACAACNQWCSWAPSVNLDVQHAPKDVRVQQTSPSSEIHSGHRVLLGCNFSSSRPRDVRFFWKKNGIFLKEGRELSFDSISPEDAGNYNCLVNNSVGQTTSEAKMLRVLYAPRMLRVAISPKDEVIEGKKAVLTCESDANPPILQYAWFDWNNQNLRHYDQMLRLDPVKVQHSGAYRCQATNRLGTGQSPPGTLTVYYSPETIGRRVAVGVGFCLATLLLAFWGVKLQRSWKRIRSQQGLQENSSGQSFFVRNKKIRRVPVSEDPHSLGCYNPVMEDAISYATLRFPVGETNTPRTRDAGTLEAEGPSPNRDDTVTYSVLQKRRVGDYENVVPENVEDEGIHYSELVHLGVGERPLGQEAVEYVTLKH